VREIVLDTETTGLDPAFGHRIVEIGCVELYNHVPTQRTFHCYVNPERDMPEEAFRVHGLSADFLADKPRFADICDDFLEFIGDAPLVIHNGAFDMKFLNAEFGLLKRPPLPMERLICTLELSRKRFAGASNSLDALCRRFDIDLSGRDKHGALIDCFLLADVYLELVGGRQPGLALAAELESSASVISLNAARRKVRPPRPHAATEEELAAHAAFLKQLDNPLWLSRMD